MTPSAEKIAKHRANAETLTHLAGANSIQRNLPRQDRMAWEYQKAMHQAITGDKMPDEEETINNTFDSPITHNHYQQPPAGMPTLAKLAVTAAALIGGPLAGFGAKTVIDTLSDPPKIVPAATDTDTTVKLQLKK